MTSHNGGEIGGLKPEFNALSRSKSIDGISDISDESLVEHKADQIDEIDDNISSDSSKLEVIEPKVSFTSSTKNFSKVYATETLEIKMEHREQVSNTVEQREQASFSKVEHRELASKSTMEGGKVSVSVLKTDDYASLGIAEVDENSEDESLPDVRSKIKLFERISSGTNVSVLPNVKDDNYDYNEKERYKPLVCLGSTTGRGLRRIESIHKNVTEEGLYEPPSLHKENKKEGENLTGIATVNDSQSSELDNGLPKPLLTKRSMSSSTLNSLQQQMPAGTISPLSTLSPHSTYSPHPYHSSFTFPDNDNQAHHHNAESMTKKSLYGESSAYIPISSSTLPYPPSPSSNAYASYLPYSASMPYTAPSHPLHPLASSGMPSSYLPYPLSEEDEMTLVCLLSQQEDVYGVNMFDSLSSVEEFDQVEQLVGEGYYYEDAVCLVFEEKVKIPEERKSKLPLLLHIPVPIPVPVPIPLPYPPGALPPPYGMPMPYPAYPTPPFPPQTGAERRSNEPRRSSSFNSYPPPMSPPYGVYPPYAPYAPYPSYPPRGQMKTRSDGNLRNSYSSYDK